MTHHLLANCNVDSDCEDGSFCVIKSGICKKCYDCSKFHRLSGLVSCPKSAGECGSCIPGYKQFNDKHVDSPYCITDEYKLEDGSTVPGEPENSFPEIILLFASTAILVTALALCLVWVIKKNKSRIRKLNKATEKRHFEKLQPIDNSNSPLDPEYSDVFDGFQKRETEQNYPLGNIYETLKGSKKLIQQEYEQLLTGIPFKDGRNTPRVAPSGQERNDSRIYDSVYTETYGSCPVLQSTRYNTINETGGSTSAAESCADMGYASTEDIIPSSASVGSPLPALRNRELCTVETHQPISNESVKRTTHGVSGAINKLKMKTSDYTKAAKRELQNLHLKNKMKKTLKRISKIRKPHRRRYQTRNNNNRFTKHFLQQNLETILLTTAIIPTAILEK